MSEHNDENLTELRELLFEPESRRLSQLEHDLENAKPEARDVGDILPDAIRVRSAQDDELGEALGSTIEGAIQSSVKRNPKVLAEAIFPVIGPAIRKSIRSALAGMMQGFNRALEESLSPRGLRWRIEAWRSKRPFAEVVLLHSLVYRVEQMFLIDRKSGIPMAHATAPFVTGEDPDLVSGMVTAIQDFMRDSFRADETSTLDAISFGDLELVAAPGPHAVLVAVVRGTAPAKFQEHLAELVERLHAQWAKELAAFDGDAESLEEVQPLLADGFLEQRRERTPSKGPGLLLVVIAIAAALGIIYLVRTNMIEQDAWQRTLTALREEPGVLLLRAEREDGEVRLEALLDQDAAAPAEILARAGLEPTNVTASWHAFASRLPGLVLRRAERLLSPPDGVDLALTDGRLVATGRADHAWVSMARQRAAAIQGVVAWDESGLVDEDLVALRDACRQLAGISVPFPEASAAPVLDDAAGADLAATLAELRRTAESTGRFVRLHILANKTTDEWYGAGDQLPDERAKAVLRLIQVMDPGPYVLVSTEAGTEVHSGRGTKGAVHRLVRLEVIVAGDVELGGAR